MQKILSHWKPLLALMILPAFLAEVFSGATLVTMFFFPGIFLGYVTVLYGLPLLVIREIAVRGRFGIIGLGILGMCYGLYNEGLRSLTIYKGLSTPLDVYVNYGLLGDIRIPLLTYLPFFWHATFSVVIPILFINYLFPKHAKSSWIGVKTTWIIGILVVASAIPIMFYSTDGKSLGTKSQVIHSIAICLAWIVLWLVARKAPKTPQIITGQPWEFNWKPFWKGFALTIMMIVVSYSLAAVHLYWPLFVLYMLLIGAYLFRSISMQKTLHIKSLVLFALGVELGQTAIGVIFGLIGGNILFAGSSVVFTIVLYVFVRTLRTNSTKALLSRG